MLPKNRTKLEAARVSLGFGGVDQQPRLSGQPVGPDVIARIRLGLASQDRA